MLPMNKTIIHRLSEVGPAYASLDELLTAVTGDWQLAHHILTAYPSDTRQPLTWPPHTKLT